MHPYAAGGGKAVHERSGADVRPAKRARRDRLTEDASIQASLQLPDDLFSTIRLDSMDLDQLQRLLDHPMLERSPAQLKAVATAGLNMPRAWRSLRPYLRDARYCYSNSPTHNRKMHGTATLTPLPIL